jgi:hypothetical protein
MPVFGPSVGQHALAGAVSGTGADKILSLDKRFDLKPSFALLSPVSRFLHFSGVAVIPSFFSALKPVGNRPAFTPLRGPPSATSLS